MDPSSPPARLANERSPKQQNQTNMRNNNNGKAGDGKARRSLFLSLL
jgi:hypothetical protein